MLLNCLAVGIGGFIGSVLRYLISTLTPQASFPWATLGINVVGTFVLACVAALVLKGVMPDDHMSLLLRVGLCGGFTTMSTFSLETMGLFQNGAYLGAIGYVLATCVLCLVAAFGGSFVVRAIA